MGPWTIRMRIENWLNIILHPLSRAAGWIAFRYCDRHGLAIYEAGGVHFPAPPNPVGYWPPSPQPPSEYRWHEGSPVEDWHGKASDS
jgi:hypothetical protein